jgi:chromosome segregation ATPase
MSMYQTYPSFIPSELRMQVCPEKPSAVILLMASYSYLQLNAALAKTSELIQQNEDLEQQLASTKEQLRDANLELEFSRAEVVDYRGYLTKCQTAEEERSEARRQRDDARQERDEARQQRDEARQESRELQVNHANVLAENKRVKDAYTKQMTRFQEDVKKLKAQKQEILELKRQLSGRAIGVIGASSSAQDPPQENLNIQRNIEADVETGIEKGLKRSHGEAFTEAVGESKNDG